MPNVLMISYFFPPQGGAGVQRSLKFSKYLPSLGWIPTVVTANRNIHGIEDDTLEKEIPPDVDIFRTKAILFPKYIPWRIKNWITRWILIIDEFIGWYPFAQKVAINLINKKNIKVLYTTSSPYTSHLIGLGVHKLTRVPWIADFRDPWIGNVEVKYPTIIHFLINNYFEKQVIQNASAVTVVSEPMRHSLIDRYKGEITNKIFVITNGYDQEDFPASQQVPQNKKFTIVYTGSFYTKSRTPESFFKGLALAIERNAIPRTQIMVNIFGNIGNFVRQQIDNYNLKDIVSLKGYVSHEESIKNLLCADVLLLIIGNSAGSENVATGKIYEYLAAHRPIFAIAGKGSAENIIRETNAGIVISPDDILSISNQLIHFYNQWENNDLDFQGNTLIISSYERKKLTGQLASIMNELAK